MNTLSTIATQRFVIEDDSDVLNRYSVVLKSTAATMKAGIADFGLALQLRRSLERVSDDQARAICDRLVEIEVMENFSRSFTLDELRMVIGNDSTVEPQ